MIGKPPTVAIASSSAFLTIALRQILAAAKVKVVSEPRTSSATAEALEASRIEVALVDVGLLTGGTESPLVRLIQSRRAPTLLIDPRNDAAIPTPMGPGEIVRLKGGGKTGSFDLGPIEAQLLSTLTRVVETWRQRTQVGSAPLIRKSPSEGWRGGRRTAEVVVIGVSTGGPMVLTTMLKGLDAPTLPLIIVQHMPADQTASFAAHLALETGLRVVEQGRGALPDVGAISVLRGGADYRFTSTRGARLQLRVAEVPDNPFHPGIDVLLLSAAEHGIAVAVAILTGMGEDGSEGVRALGAQGLPVVAQAPETCAVPGMPNAAIATGAVSEVLGPNAIVERINGWMRKASAAASTGKKSAM